MTFGCAGSCVSISFWLLEKNGLLYLGLVWAVQSRKRRNRVAISVSLVPRDRALSGTIAVSPEVIPLFNACSKALLKIRISTSVVLTPKSCAASIPMNDGGMLQFGYHRSQIDGQTHRANPMVYWLCVRKRSY